MMERWVGEDGKPLFKGYDHFKVVKSLEEDDYAHHERAGWHLLAVLDGQQEVVVELENVRDRHGNFTHQLQLQSAHVVTKAHFLFGMPTAGVVADLKKQLDDARNEMYDERANRFEVEGELAKEKKTGADLLNAKDALEKRIEALEESKRSLRADFAQHNNDYKKLLDDLMKLRRHFGEAAVQNALGSQNEAIGAAASRSTAWPRQS